MARGTFGAGTHARETGSATLELAVVFPLLLVLLAGLADFPRVFFWDMELTNAARAGAQFGGGLHASMSGNTANIQSAAADAAPELSSRTRRGSNPLKSSAIVVTRTCECVDLGTAAVFPLAGCNTVCPGRVVGMLTVRAPATFENVFQMPFLPSVLKLGSDATRPQATVRLVP